MKIKLKLLLLFLTVFSSTLLMINYGQAILYEMRLNPEVDKKVGAFYYPWFGNTTDYSSPENYTVDDTANWWHWDFPERGWFPPTNACSTNTPTIGWYDSSDPDTIKLHLEQANYAEIDGFISSFWGRNCREFKHMKTMAEVASNMPDMDVKISAYYEVFLYNESLIGTEVLVQNVVADFEALWDFMTNETYKDVMWYQDGKPVVFVYVVKNYNQTMEFFLVADRPQDDKNLNLLFPARHQYDVYAPTKSGNYMNDFYTHKKKAQSANQLFIAGVAPGYDDTVVRDGNPPLLRENGETYKESWENAVSLNPDWITITSWNEWHEGTEIEPSIENGELALEQTKRFIQEFKSGRYEELSLISYKEAFPLYRIIAIVSIVLLSVSAPLLLIDLGISYKRKYKNSMSKGIIKINHSEDQ